MPISDPRDGLSYPHHIFMKDSNNLHLIPMKVFGFDKHADKNNVHKEFQKGTTGNSNMEKKSWLRDFQSDVIEAFNSTSRYLDDLLNIDNNFFDSMVNRISGEELYKL